LWTGISTEADDREEDEVVPYQVVDSTHLKLYPTLVHGAHNVFAVGGACQYGVEQHAQTHVQGGETIYPILFSIDATHVAYAGGPTGPVLGVPGAHNFENASCTVSSVQKTGTTATITVTGCSGIVGNLNGQTATISGIVVDPSFNGTFSLTQGAAGAWTYTTTSGTVALTSTSGSLMAGDITANVYPVTEVLAPQNPAAPTTPGYYLTTPYYFPTASAQVARSFPYYSLEQGSSVSVIPNEDAFFGGFGANITIGGGAARNDAVTGATQKALNIQNALSPYGAYQGYGGTYNPPDEAIEIQGLWKRGLHFDTGDNIGMFFEKGNLPQGATNWFFCPFGSTGGDGICVNSSTDLSSSTMSFKSHSFAFDDFTGGTTTFTITPFTHTALFPLGNTASSSALLLTGNPLTGGTGTTNFPLSYFNQGAAVSTFNTAGTELGFNAPSGFTGNFLDFHLNGGASIAKLDSAGNLTVTSCTGCGGGGGSGTVSGQAVGVIPLGTSATVIGSQSHLDDGITTSGTITSSEPIAITGSTHGLTIPAGTAVAGAAGKVIYTSDATSGFAEVNENNTGLSRVCTAANGVCGSGGIANATFTVGTTAIGANSCSSSSTVPMTGVATTSVFMISPNADVSGTTGWGSTGGLVIDAWPTANTLNYKVCNQTSSSITPSASVTFNVGAR